LPLLKVETPSGVKLTATANKSLERTARQLASYQRYPFPFGLYVAGGQPLNSSVRRFFLI